MLRFVRARPPLRIGCHYRLLRGSSIQRRSTFSSSPIPSVAPRKEEEDDNILPPTEESTTARLKDRLKIGIAPSILTQLASSSQHVQPAESHRMFRGLPSGFAQDLRINRAFRVISSDHSTTAITRALIGNSLIAVMKLWAWHATKSSAMLSEAIHTIVDTGNQALLLIGTKQAQKEADSKHPYGYGRAAFFWSLVSALGMFWLGAGVTTAHGIDVLMHPPEVLHISWHTWAVLAGSFFIDGHVLRQTLNDLWAQKPEQISFFRFMQSVKDPMILAVILEDLGAVTGVAIAASGIGMTLLTGDTMYDGIASVSIGCLLGLIALSLVNMNKQFLLGRSLPQRTQDNIATILYSRKSIQKVYAVNSEWVAPSKFAYRAEIDFNHKRFAQVLSDKYTDAFKVATDAEITLLLEEYADELGQLVEDEVDKIETVIRHFYPEAAYIELEPRSNSVFTKPVKKHRQPATPSM